MEPPKQVQHPETSTNAAVGGGKFLQMHNNNFDLIINILIGIRRTVANLSEASGTAIDDRHFRKKIVTENDWVSSNQKEEKVVRFVDYSPLVFQRLRQRTCISEDDYMKSLGPEQILNSFWTNDFQTLYELCSSGQSGALFYFTQDRKYMMKTIAEREFKFLKRILPQYYQFRIKNPYSMIVQFYGTFKLEWGSDNKKLTNKIYIVVMDNLFKNFQIGIRFDLKGSVTGRSTLKAGQDLNTIRDTSIALKDNDFRKFMPKLDLVEQILPRGANKTLLEILSDDADFLASCDIIDYSCLVGEIKLTELGEKGIQDLKDICKRLPVFGTNVYLDKSGRAWLIGVIDPLNGYTFVKKVEYFVKRCKHGNNMSCIPPQLYATRFKHFMSTDVFRQEMQMQFKAKLLKKLHTRADSGREASAKRD